MRHVQVSLCVATLAAAGCSSPMSGSTDIEWGHAPAPDAGLPDGALFPPGPVVQADSPPPPVSGGTLIVTRDDLAVAADPARDRIWVVDAQEGVFVGEIELEPGDEPGRLVQDGSGAVHVALRSGGAVATVDLDALEASRRREVCGAPRGVAWDEADDVLHVACAGGELVRLPARDGEPSRTTFIEPDLRDVIVDGERLLVSTFREANLLVLDKSSGTVEERIILPPLDNAPTPGVAWRTIPRPQGGVWMLHQGMVGGPVEVDATGYGSGPCRGGVSATMLTRIVPGEELRPGGFTGMPMAVDVAPEPGSDGVEVAVVSASPEPPFDQPFGVFFDPEFNHRGCLRAAPDRIDAPGGITAAAYAGGRLVVQTREPAAIASIGWRVELPGARPIEDTGHRIFHQATHAGVACASCHPEGRDDGHVWDFDGVHRRTQSLVGGLLGTEPFHWDGALQDLGVVMDGTFVERMGGPTLSDEQVMALGTWIDAQPAVSAAADADAAERGRALFEGEAGCTDCHSGPKYTDNRTVKVGTGGAFQVPPLRGVGLRAPYFHDGCAETLEEVLLGCKRTGHGDSLGLEEAERADLVEYLRTL